MSEKTKAYRIQLPYYRKGRYFEPGSIVHIPEGEKPSRTWTPVEPEPVAPSPSAPKPQPQPAPQETGKPKRPSDRDIA